ncbi:MAG TPA: ribbon-helix-helix protein, CopG family [Myxococcales bacterium]|jgi:predicted transcriptional regulator
MGEKANMAVKLEADLRERLKALGEAKQRSTHWLMKEAIKRYVEVEEEAELAKKEARQRAARFEATGEYVAHEDVDAWLRSWGSKKELPVPARTRKWPR